jgi:transposase
MEFVREFPGGDACLEHLLRSRYAPDGEHVERPKCKQERVCRKYKMAQGRQSWTCTGCGYHLHPTAGTIFHKSSTSLHLWFYAMYLVASTRCGILAKNLERAIGVSYPTAWRMLNKIRNEVMDEEPLTGNVKSSIRGTYRKVLVLHKWLQGYLNEFAWRYNYREPSMFAELLACAARPMSMP